MSTTHTPGPWVAVQEHPPYKHWKVEAALGGYEGTLYAGNVGVGLSEWDARLIAAAPDLLEALIVCRGQWIHSINAAQCLAAIAKAEGL